MPNTEQRFTPVAIFLHWAVAAGVIFTVILAWLIESIDGGDPNGLALAVHKSVGITIFILVWARLAWRLTHRPPAYTENMPRWQRLGAGAAHVLLYALTLIMPITGYVSVAARGRDTFYLGLLQIPQLTPLDRMLSRSAEAAHAYGQYALYILVLVHVGAALYHHIILRDGILRRMLPNRRQSP